MYREYQISGKTSNVRQWCDSKRPWKNESIDNSRESINHRNVQHFLKFLWISCGSINERQHVNCSLLYSRKLFAWPFHVNISLELWITRITLPLLISVFCNYIGRLDIYGYGEKPISPRNYISSVECSSWWSLCGCIMRVLLVCASPVYLCVSSLGLLIHLEMIMYLNNSVDHLQQFLSILHSRGLNNYTKISQT